MKRDILLLAGAAMGALALAPNANAQTASEAATAPTASGAPATDDTESASDDAIVVTARRRSELLQDVPIAVSAITEEMVVRTGISGIEAIAIATPNLDFSRQISQGATPFLRGVGSTQAAAGGESPVAVYVDDVYIGSPNGNLFAFNNIAGIQVLKGPQGTLFGRNATGGVVQVQTKRPTFEPAFEASLGYGNYESVEGSLYATTGITDTLAVNIAGSGRKQREGFGRSLVTGVPVQRGWDWDVRGQLLWQPGDTTRVLLIGDYGKQRSDAGSNGSPPPGSVSVSGATFAGDFDTRTLGTDYAYIKRGGVSLRIDQETSFADLVSISAYRYTRLEFVLDQDEGAAPLVQVGPVRSPNKSISQEFQLISKPESSVKWIVGLFYLRTKTGYDPSRVGGLFFAPLQFIDLRDEQTLNSYSAFGEATFSLLPETNLTLGLRYTRDDYAEDVEGRFGNGTIPLPGNTFSQEDSFSKLTYRAILDHKFTPDIMGYASFSRGFRSGGYNLAFPGNAANPAPAVEPEVLDAYEVGLKTKFFDGDLTVNGAAFYYDYTNVAIAFVQPGGSLTLNAAGSRIKGLDFDFIATPLDGLRLSGGVGILDGEYTSFPNGPIILPNPATCAPTPTTLPGPRTGGNLVCSGDLSGKTTVRTPKFTLSLSPSYTLGTAIGDFTLAAAYYHNSGFSWDVQNRLTEPSYDVVNASLTWAAPDESFSVRLWGKNLTDERYAVFKAGDVVSDRVSFAAPRTYGVTMSAKF